LLSVFSLLTASKSNKSLQKRVYTTSAELINLWAPAECIAKGDIIVSSLQPPSKNHKLQIAKPKRRENPAFACLVGYLKPDMIPWGLTPISDGYCILRKVSSLLSWLLLLLIPYFLPLPLLNFRPAKEKKGLEDLLQEFYPSYWWWNFIWLHYNLKQRRVCLLFLRSTDSRFCSASLSCHKCCLQSTLHRLMSVLDSLLLRTGVRRERVPDPMKTKNGNTQFILLLNRFSE
jgi:hypothetical protein